MKTFTLITIILILLLPVQTFSQANDNLKLKPDNLLQERIMPHSIPVKQDWNTLESDSLKVKESRTIINKTILDTVFLLNEELWQNWDGSNWVNRRMKTYKYDVDNNKIEELVNFCWKCLNWQDSMNDTRFTYTYDVNNNMIEDLRQDWDGSNWVNYTKDSCTYGGNNNMIKKFVESWGKSKYHWYTYTYDGNNNMIEELLQSGSAGWSKTIYTYDGNNNLIEMLSIDSELRAYDKKWTYTYDGNNMIKKLKQRRRGSNWGNIEKLTCTYDGNNNVIEKVYQNWDDPDWLGYAKHLFSYDENDNLIERIDMKKIDNFWINKEKRIRKYSQ